MRTLTTLAMGLWATGGLCAVPATAQERSDDLTQRIREIVRQEIREALREARAEQAGRNADLALRAEADASRVIEKHRKALEKAKKSLEAAKARLRDHVTVRVDSEDLKGRLAEVHERLKGLHQDLEIEVPHVDVRIPDVAVKIPHAPHVVVPKLRVLGEGQAGGSGHGVLFLRDGDEGRVLRVRKSTDAKAEAHGKVHETHNIRVHKSGDGESVEDIVIEGGDGTEKNVEVRVETEDGKTRIWIDGKEIDVDDQKPGTKRDAQKRKVRVLRSDDGGETTVLGLGDVGVDEVVKGKATFLGKPAPRAMVLGTGGATATVLRAPAATATALCCCCCCCDEVGCTCCEGGAAKAKVWTSKDGNRAIIIEGKANWIVPSPTPTPTPTPTPEKSDKDAPDCCAKKPKGKITV